MPEFDVIGKRLGMLDGPAKVSGAAVYTDDLVLPGMLFGKILHSTLPHARIRRLDTRRAEALSGVRAVAVGADFPNRYGILPIGHDETALAVGKVRYIGDNVAAVAAETMSIAECALELMEVEYQPLTPYVDPLESMKAEADLIHDGRPHNIEKNTTTISETWTPPSPPVTWCARTAIAAPKLPMPPWSRTPRWPTFNRCRSRTAP